MNFKPIVLIKSFLFVLVLYSAGVCGNYRYFPTNFDGDSLTLAEKDSVHFANSTVAVSGVVDKIDTVTTDGGKKPYLRLRLNEKNPEENHLWIASLVNLDSSEVNLGDEIRVLGHLATIDPENNHGELEFNSQGFHLFGLIIINLTKQGIHVLPGTEKQLEAWKAGALDKL